MDSEGRACQTPLRSLKLNLVLNAQTTEGKLEREREERSSQANMVSVLNDFNLNCIRLVSITLLDLSCANPCVRIRV